jgi:hypothetical protein
MSSSRKESVKNLQHHLSTLRVLEKLFMKCNASKERDYHCGFTNQELSLSLLEFDENLHALDAAVEAEKEEYEENLREEVKAKVPEDGGEPFSSHLGVGRLKKTIEPFSEDLINHRRNILKTIDEGIALGLEAAKIKKDTYELTVANCKNESSTCTMFKESFKYASEVVKKREEIQEKNKASEFISNNKRYYGSSLRNLYNQVIKKTNDEDRSKDIPPRSFRFI